MSDLTYHIDGPHGPISLTIDSRDSHLRVVERVVADCQNTGYLTRRATIPSLPVPASILTGLTLMLACRMDDQMLLDLLDEDKPSDLAAAAQNIVDQLTEDIRSHHNGSLPENWPHIAAIIKQAFVSGLRQDRSNLPALLHHAAL